MIIRIDARRLTDAVGLHAVVSEAFGFPATYGKNLDALIDCLSSLDNPRAGMTRFHVAAGQVAIVALEHLDAASKQASAQASALIDALAFVNWRRVERGQPPVLAVAYERAP